MIFINPENQKGTTVSPNRYAYQTVKRYWNRRPFLIPKREQHIYGRLYKNDITPK
jgi:hypothetical protein